MKQIQLNTSGLFTPQDAWDTLSMQEKAEMMKVAVRNGITNLQDIRAKYNEFAKGGDTDWSYTNWKNQIAKHLGINPDEDNTYDYEGYFRKYPEEAWKMLNGDSDAHFTDEFKTVYHPTFSAASPNNDGSIYSGVKHPRFNPEGLKGGTWSPDYSSFTMSYDGYRGPVDMDDRAWYLMNNENNGAILRESDGSLPVYDGIPWAGVLPNVTITGRKHSISDNVFRKGGYKPSDSVKKRISTWEGGAMTGAKDPLSGKYGKNRSFEAEASSFTDALPESIREQVLSNPELADNLYSYSYNVGAGNFKKRVVPALERYYAGNGSAEEIANSMWASGDKKLRGLRTRRAIERQGVISSLATPIVIEQPVSTNIFNPYRTQVENTMVAPQVVPDKDSYVRAHQLTEEEDRVNKFNEQMEAINRFNTLMNLIAPQNNETESYQSSNPLFDYLSIFGNTNASGGNIHIKPSHRGRLTELKKRTGKTEAELYRTGGPAVRKMITFARNSRKWKHGEGGNLFYPGGNITYGHPFYSYDNNGQLILDENGKPILNYNASIPEIVITPSRKPIGLDRLNKGMNFNSNYTVGEYARKAGEDAVRETRRQLDEAAARFNSHNEMYSQVPVGEVSGLPIYKTVKDQKVIGVSGADPIGEFVVATAALGPLFKAAETAGLYGLGRYGSKLGLEAEQNWARANILNREFARSPLGTVESPALSAINRTRVGDVEIDNPNLLYHLDRGNRAGAFSDQGAFINDGYLYPGTPKDASATPYSWWNLGKPYSTSVNGKPMTRLMTTTKDAPGMLHVRSQNYPIGQWNGQRGLVFNSEYVNPEAVDVYNSTYKFEPNYGYKKVTPKEPVITWEEANSYEPFTFKGFKEDPYQIHLKRAQDNGFDTSGIDIVDMRTDSNLRQKVIEYYAKDRGLSEKEALQELTNHLNNSGNAAAIRGIRAIIYNDDANLSAKLSHELEHILHLPEEAIPDEMLTPRVTKIHGKRYTQLNNTEYSALGSQIRDYYGHTGNEAITPGMLRYARKNYEKDTGIHNRMTEMLNNHLDLDFLAKWLTRYSTGLAVPTAIGLSEFNNE